MATAPVLHHGAGWGSAVVKHTDLVVLGSSNLFSLELTHPFHLDKEQRTRENLRAVSHNAWRVERSAKRDIIFQPGTLESSHHFLYAESFPHSAPSLAVVDQDPAGPGCPSAGLSLCHLVSARPQISSS